MANTFKFGNGNWAVKDGSVLAYNDENNNFKPLPFDFTRDSIATRVNRDGLIEVVPNNMPRIDFTDNTSGHLLLEPSRTNNFQRSEEFNNSYWTKTNSTVTANQIVSPDGSQNADTLTQSSAGGYLRKDVSFSGSETASFFVKANSVNFVSLFSGGNEVYFDLINGSASSSSGSTLVSYKIDSYGSGWYRCSITTSYSGSSSVRLYPSQSDGLKGTTIGSVYVYGAQLEAGSYATSYIPTEGSSVTRVAETGVDCLLPNETIINNSTATVYLEFEALANDASNRWISFEEVGVATDNQFEFRLATGSNLMQIVTRSAGGGQDVVMSETLTDITSNNKIAFNYDGLNWKLAVNGSITDTATAARLFNDNIKKIKFSRYTDTNHFYGKVKDLKIYNTALTDAELEKLTS